MIVKKTGWLYDHNSLLVNNFEKLEISIN